MNCSRRASLKMLAMLAIVSVGSTLAADFEMTRWSIDGGGMMHSTGGTLELSGTTGQPDAGTMTGGTFELTGGFWFPFTAGDGNGDGAVDLGDYDVFEACLTGPGGASPEGLCVPFDVDGNGAVDLGDFAVIQKTFTRPQ